MHINKRLNKKEHNIDKFYKNISSGKSFQKKIHSHGKLAEQRGGVNFGNGTLAGGEHSVNSWKYKKMQLTSPPMDHSV